MPKEGDSFAEDSEKFIYASASRVRGLSVELIDHFALKASVQFLETPSNAAAPLRRTCPYARDPCLGHVWAEHVSILEKEHS